jgi:hypothetical protein
MLLAGVSASPAFAASPVVRVGNEFQVNSTTFLWQREPSVVGLSNGRFVIVWKDDSQAAPDTSGASIRMRRFSSDGSPLGHDVVVNTQRNHDQEQPAVAALHGSFFVVWADGSGAGADKSGTAIRGRRLDNSGAKLGKEFQINQRSDGDQDSPALTALENGRLAAAWENAADGVGGHAFRASGVRVGDEFQANSTDAVSLPLPAIAGLESGGFVVAWTGIRENPGQRGSPAIVARRFDSDGVKRGGEILVSTTKPGAQENAAIAALGDSRYVVVWQDDSETGADDDGLAVRGQIMSGRMKVGREFLVPTRRTGDQEQPAVAAFRDGRFVVVWTDSSLSPDDQTGSAIRGQLYSRNGTKVGREFRVNRRTAGNQEAPAVAVLDNRDFVVVWVDWSFAPPDQSASGIRGQVFRVRR